jgi:YfiH family protein
MTLDIITSDSLAPLRHGFFSRRGGVSSGIFAGLNCGRASSDQTDAVTINRQRVCEAMGIAPASLATVYQLHSTSVHVVSTPPGAKLPRADAMVTRTAGIALAILTADCQPVLFADHRARVIGAAHAGWRGALHGVLEETLLAMERLGATRSDICAVIGPAISQRAYEVGPELRDQFLADDQGNAQYFTQGEGDRQLFDLTAYGLHRLRGAGVKQAQWTRHCTYSDADRFFSFRRSVHAKEADYGRLISAICL